MHSIFLLINPIEDRVWTKKMMHYLETLAKEENMETMSLRVMPKNKPAIILYEKLGFKNVRTIKMGRHDDGKKISLNFSFYP